MTARALAQAKHERIAALVLEIDSDFGTCEFGVAPCTATGEKCYKTYSTCKDKPHFAKGTKTDSFCLRGMAIPPGETLRPYISAHSFSPTEIPIGGGLAVRSRPALTLADEVCSDWGSDPYITTRSTPAQGTYWTRYLARNPNIQGKFARLKKGYITEPFDWAVFQTELYVIDSIKGPDGSGNVQIVLSDVVKTLDKNLLPAPTSGKLVAELKAIEQTGMALAGGASTISLALDAQALDDVYNGMEVYLYAGMGTGQRRVISDYVGSTRVATLSAAWDVEPNTSSAYQVSALSINVGSGNGAQYADPATSGEQEYIAIGDEVIRYTAKSGDVLSWSSSLYRAQFGTARDDQSVDAGVQQCFVLIDKSATDAIHALENAAGIADTYIDLAGLAQEDADCLGTAARITVCIPAPEQSSGLLHELLRDLNVAAWWDAVAQQHKFKADLPQFVTTVKSITPVETVGKTMQIEPLDSLRITRSAISIDPYSASGDMTARGNFKTTYEYRDASAEGPNEYNGIVQKQTYSRWLSSANALHAAALVSRQVKRLRDVPFRAKFKLDPRDEVAMGDLIDLTTSSKTDASGAPVVKRMRVTKLLESGNFDAEAVSTTFDDRAAFIAPDGTADYPTDTTYASISDSNGLMPDGAQGSTII